jgi:exopolysaccharide production protein ExoZ
MQQIVPLQYLRAVAAVAVLIHHFAEAFNYKTHVGAAGVDVFFVISGFVMALVTDRSVSPVKFLTDRLIRIVPMYWLCTLFLFACVRAKPNLFPLDSSDTSHLLKSLFFIPHISPLGTTYPLVGQGWTLVYEMFFYAVFAFALWVSYAHKVAIVTISIFALVGVGALLQSDNIAVSTYTSPLMIEFIAGIWLFLFYRRGAMPGAVISTILVAVSLTWFAVVEFVQPPFRLFQFGVPAFLLVTGCLGLEKYIKAKASLLEIGNASYSIYLTHWFSLLFVTLLAKKLGVSGWPIIAASVPTAVVLGIAAHKFIEAPINRTLKAASRRKVAVA